METQLVPLEREIYPLLVRFHLGSGINGNPRRRMPARGIAQLLSAFI